MAQTARGEFLNANIKVNWPEGQEKTAWAAWGTIGLCGVLFVSQKNILFRTLEAIAPSHSFAKTHSSLSVAILLIFHLI